VLAAVAVARVGHTGGELVYKHGAALAYLDGPTAAKSLGRKAMKTLLSAEGLAINAGEAGAAANSAGPSGGDGSASGSGRNQRGKDQ
jgi:hypothetical protein